MPKRGKIRRIFPGGNTSGGFCSLYDHILPQDQAARIFVLKGGPGVGKSTFIERIGEEMLSRGFDIEYLQCSSDNDSLDGMLVPSIAVAVIDGTSPHIVDPKTPGVVDEIINLGEYWDESKLRPMRDAVLDTNRRTGRMFQIAYSLLKEAKAAYDEWGGYISECIDRSEYARLSNGLAVDIFSGVPDNYKASPKQRHMFASAITPGGLKSYANTLIAPGMKVYALDGGPGSGIREILSRISQTAEYKGLSTELFHCPFAPDSLDMVIIHGIDTAVVNVSKPFHHDVPGEKTDFGDCIEQEKLLIYREELDDCKARFAHLLEASIAHLAKAKAAHDAMEKYYVASMDFKGVEQKRQQVLQRILRYADEK